MTYANDSEYLSYVNTKLDVYIDMQLRFNPTADASKILQIGITEYLSESERVQIIEYLYGLYSYYSKNKQSYELIRDYDEHVRIRRRKTDKTYGSDAICPAMDKDEKYKLHSMLFKATLTISSVFMLIYLIVFGIINIDATGMLLSIAKLLNM